MNLTQRLTLKQIVIISEITYKFSSYRKQIPCYTTSIYKASILKAVELPTVACCCCRSISVFQFPQLMPRSRKSPVRGSVLVTASTYQPTNCKCNSTARSLSVARFKFNSRPFRTARLSDSAAEPCLDN